jgi:glyoxylase-like metal-dependent hydrolase (beta-lactamase superfamily II)
MRSPRPSMLAMCISVLMVSHVAAQDLGPNVRKLTEGIYVYVGNDRPNDLGPESNIGIVLTQEGVVLIDTGQNVMAARAVEAAVKKLTSQPVRYVIATETHADHHAGDFVFSPPGVSIAHEGTTGALRDREAGDPARVEKLRASSPEMRAAFEGYRFVLPDVEYRHKMTLNLGERTFELLYLGSGVHSEADTAVWLPKERVLFSASVVVNGQFNVIRPWLTIPDILSATKMFKGLNPEFVIPGHGAPGSVKIFADMEQYYAVLVDRVDKMVKQGKSLEQIQQELKMPEYDHWMSKNRIPGNIEMAYRFVAARLVFKDN